MKKIFLILFLFLSINSYSQQKKDSTNLWWWNNRYVSEREWKDSLRISIIEFINLQKKEKVQKRFEDSIRKVISIKLY